jgi:hypothetical protein
MRSAQLNESFEFIANGTVIEMDVAEAAALFPAVREQLLVDGRSRKFFMQNSGMEAADIRSLLSGESIFMKQSHQLLAGLFGNENLELLFLGCQEANIRKNLSDLMKERRLDLESVDVSILSIDALDSLLLSESVSVESEDSLLRIILKLGPDYRNLLRHIQIAFLNEDGLSLLEEHFEIPPESLWECVAERIAHPPLSSRIISDLPEVFKEFRRFSLLWRGSRDGFEAQEFHRRCDGHPNTLTVILDTNGNIFGGFTPVKLESGGWHFKADDSLKSFLFTVNNPHDIPARRFWLRGKTKNQAIFCYSANGPCFGGGGRCDICVKDNCNAKTESFTALGNAYPNNTGLDRDVVFTGSHYFQVKEIEVFEITDSTSLQANLALL